MGTNILNPLLYLALNMKCVWPKLFEFFFYNELNTKDYNLKKIIIMNV